MQYRSLRFGAPRAENPCPQGHPDPLPSGRDGHR
jgi:hypothetical protein